MPGIITDFTRLIEQRDYKLPREGHKPISFDKSYVFQGMVFLPGNTYHLPDDVHEEMSKSVARINDTTREKNDAERRRVELLNMSQGTAIPTSSGLSADKVQELISQALDSERAKIREEIKAQLLSETGRFNVVDEILKSEESEIDRQLLEKEVTVPEGSTKQIKAEFLARSAGYSVPSSAIEPPKKSNRVVST